jgi:hypothetical protein
MHLAIMFATLLVTLITEEWVVHKTQTCVTDSRHIAVART